MRPPELLLSVEIDQLSPQVEAGAVDLLRLDHRIADVVGVNIASCAVDEDCVRGKARNAGQLLPVDIGCQADLLREVCALPRATAYISRRLRRVVEL
jgi:hypothetical protein